MANPGLEASICLCPQNGNSWFYFSKTIYLSCVWFRLPIKSNITVPYSFAVLRIEISLSELLGLRYTLVIWWIKCIEGIFRGVWVALLNPNILYSVWCKQCKGARNNGPPTVTLCVLQCADYFDLTAGFDKGYIGEVDHSIVRFKFFHIKICIL